MSEGETIKIKREWLHQAAELAKLCSTEATRERVLVAQTAALALRDYLSQKSNLVTETGRSANVKYLDLLDVCDFKYQNWLIEARTIMQMKNPALFVPTIPVMVGVFSDFYVCLQVNQNISEVKIWGFATQGDLAEAEFSPNGLLAIIPAGRLRPIKELAAELTKPKPNQDEETQLFKEWEERARRIMVGLGEVLEKEKAFNFEEAKRITTKINEEVLRIYGVQQKNKQLAPFFNRMLDQFDLEPPVPASPEAELKFLSLEAEKQRYNRNEKRKQFFTKKMTPGERISLYRFLLENNDALTEHRRIKAVFDQVTGGDFQTSVRRQSKKRILRKKADNSWIETPIAKDVEDARKEAFANEFAEEKKVTIDQLKPNTIIRGSLLPEPVQIITTVNMGDAVKIIGKGLKSNQVFEPVFDFEKIGLLTLTPEGGNFDGDAFRFRMGIEAIRLGLAYEYDPYFALSIARVDPPLKRQIGWRNN